MYKNNIIITNGGPTPISSRIFYADFTRSKIYLQTNGYGIYYTFLQLSWL